MRICLRKSWHSKESKKKKTAPDLCTITFRSRRSRANSPPYTKKTSCFELSLFRLYPGTRIGNLCSPFVSLMFTSQPFFFLLLADRRSSFSSPPSRKKETFPSPKNSRHSSPNHGHSLTAITSPVSSRLSTRTPNSRLHTHPKTFLCFSPNGSVSWIKQVIQVWTNMWPARYKNDPRYTFCLLLSVWSVCFKHPFSFPFSLIVPSSELPSSSSLLEV